MLKRVVPDASPLLALSQLEIRLLDPVYLTRIARSGGYPILLAHMMLHLANIVMWRSLDLSISILGAQLVGK
jgi:hypothetical protein